MIRIAITACAPALPAPAAVPLPPGIPLHLVDGRVGNATAAAPVRHVPAGCDIGEAPAAHHGAGPGLPGCCTAPTPSCSRRALAGTLVVGMNDHSR
jgi:hypothetical protein